MQKIETVKLKSHNGMQQNVSTRINDSGQPEITGRTGKYRIINADSIQHATGKRKQMQITAMMISVFNY